MPLLRSGGQPVAIPPGSARGTVLLGFDLVWFGRCANEFPGARVEVFMLVAIKAGV